MKGNNFTSPYAKMYMVGPAVYEKLLNCLDEVDKKMTENLNTNPVEENENLRPSERHIQTIQNEELNINEEPTLPPPPPPLPPPLPPPPPTPPPQPPQPIEQIEPQVPIETPTPEQPELTPIEPEPEPITPIPNILRSPCPQKITDMRNVQERIGPCGNKKPILVVPKKSTKKRGLACPECQKTFALQWNLNHHIKTAHRQGYTKKLLEMVKAANTDSTVECPLCHRWFNEQYELDNHFDMYHPSYTTEEGGLNTSPSLPDTDITMKKQAKKIFRPEKDDFIDWSTRSLPRKVKRPMDYSETKRHGKKALQDDADDEDEDENESNRNKTSSKKSSAKKLIETTDPFVNPAKKVNFNEWG